ncbi:MAG: OPT/YSL family transporter [Thermoplasmatota archaeon]
MPVRSSTYRRPATPAGLERVERGELRWLDTESFANFNTGVLEEYLEERNRREGFRVSRFNWRQMVLGIVVGTFFAFIIQYVGLKVGIAVGAAWYVIFIVALWARWTPADNNLAACAGSAAQYISSGFVFTYPAIYLLTYHPSYTHIISEDQIPSAALALVCTVVSSWLGIMYFIIFRRLWVVEDTLPLPGFEAGVKLLDIAKDLTSGAIESAKRSIKLVAAWGGATALFTFLRDMPVVARDEAGRTVRLSILDSIFGGANYHGGIVKLSDADSRYTWLSYNIAPILFGIGWFQRFRTALLVSLGTFVSWFVIIPMAVLMHVPVQSGGEMVDVSTLSFASWTAYKSISNPIAIGAILGGGFTALFKMLPSFRAIFKDVWSAVRGGGAGADYVPGRGWYEWPLSHIAVMILVVVATVGGAFSLSGYPPLQSFIYSAALAAAVFFLGAIAVKVMGEVGIEPVSGTSFIALLIVMLLLWLAGTPTPILAVMSILGTTVFACSISMSGNAITNFKYGLYVGNRPYHMVKAMLIAIVPGAVVAVVAASVFSYGLATEKLDFLAPQAHAFAYMVQVLLGGQTAGQLATYLGFGLCIGVFMELMTGMGTAFGLGMYFPLWQAFALLTGGAARDIWQRHFLEPRAKAEGWDERRRTLRMLDGFMMATGLIVGEAIMGTVVAIVIMYPV